MKNWSMPVGKDRLLICLKVLAEYNRLCGGKSASLWLQYDLYGWFYGEMDGTSEPDPTGYMTKYGSVKLKKLSEMCKAKD